MEGTLFQDSSDAEAFKTVMSGKLWKGLNFESPPCRLLALLDVIVNKDLIIDEDALVLAVRSAIEDLDIKSTLTVETIRLFVEESLANALADDFGEHQPEGHHHEGLEELDLDLSSETGFPFNDWTSSSYW